MQSCDAVHIADSVKVALGIGNCALGSYFLVVPQVNHCIFVPYVESPNALLPMTNCQSFDLAALDGYWVLAYKKNAIGAFHTVYII